MSRSQAMTRLPLIGWSTAIDRFRSLVQNGAIGDSVLIIGEPGVGERTLAETYKFYYRTKHKQSLRIVPIGPGTADIPPRCIAITHHAPSYGRFIPPGRRKPVRIPETAPVHLDTNKPDAIPEGECPGELLGDAVVAGFAHRLYLPPLRRRLIDALALLHFYGLRVFPSEGSSCRAVESDLIHQLLLDRPWTGHVSGLLSFLRDKARTDGPVLRRSASPEFKPLVDWDAERSWYEMNDVPIESLPKVAVSIVAARYPNEELGGPEFTRPITHPGSPLGASRLWAAAPYWPDGVDPAKATGEELLQAMAGPFAAGPLPDEFVKSLSGFTAFGATVQSLQSGFAVTPASVPDPLLRTILDKKPRKPREPKTASTEEPKLTPEENEVGELLLKLGSQKKVAEELGLTPGRISQIVSEAKKKMGPEFWEEYYEPKAERYGKKVKGHKARTQRLPRDLADPHVQEPDPDHSEA
jgi:hypothetical protein